MYAHNLAEMADVLEAVRDRKGVDMIELTAELAILLGDGAKAQQDPAAKRRRLEKFFDATKKNVSGKALAMDTKKLAADLRAKAQAFGSHIRRQEWLKTIGTFNGYYDNAGRRVEGVVNNARRITLTSGVFSLMSGVATDTQAATVYKTLSQTLKEKKYGTFRLNTNFKEVKLDLGRAFAFSYGDKENGAIFAHMDVMFAFSLYRRGFVQEGWQLVKGLASLATGEDARTYPCISEYYNSDYRGLYNFLTGSASWYTYLLVTQIFGLKHSYGDLTLEPKLTREQFGGRGELSITASIDGRPCTVVYRNRQNKDYGHYGITDVTVNGITFPVKNRMVFTLDRMGKKALLVKNRNEIVVTLG